MYLKETEDIIKKKNELIRVADRTVLSEEEKQRLLKESENTKYTQGQRDKILEDLKNSLSLQEKINLDNEITRLTDEIKAITQTKIKQMEEKRMTDPNMVAEPAPKKEKKSTIKEQVADLEHECYDYLRGKCNNDTKVLVSLISKMMGRSREDKKNEE